MARTVDLEPGGGSASGQRAGRDVRDEVSKAIDPANRAFDSILCSDRLRPIERLDLRKRRTEALRLESQAQLCGDRRQNVSPVKRMRYLGQPILCVDELDHLRWPVALGEQTEQAIVGGQIMLI